MQIMETLMSCEAASILLLDETGKNLIFAVALGKKGKAVTRFKLPLGKGIAGKVAQTGKPLIIYDAYKDPRFFKDFDKKTGFKTRSLICVPLKVQDKIIGVAEVLNPKRKRRFSDQDVASLSIFASQVAMCIESARLHKEILDQKRTEQELLFAQSVQESFLPSQLPESRYFSLAAVTKPARIIGGDFYDAFHAGKKTFLFTGDVSGKGPGAALYMASFMSTIRFSCTKSSNLHRIMKILNDSLCDASPKGFFITLIAFCIQGRSVECANAGHTDPIIYSSKHDKAYRLMLSEKEIPLGIMKNRTYSCGKITLHRGDSLIAFSDGVTEAKNKKGQMFTYMPLLQHRSWQQDPDRLIESLLKKISRFKGSAEQFDDITIMALKIK